MTRIQIKEGGVFVSNDPALGFRRVVASTGGVVLYNKGGDRNYKCQRTTFLRFMRRSQAVRQGKTRDLHLPLKAEYFDAIAAGTKPEEYRLATDYWRKRLQGRTYDRVILTRGYPRRDDASRRLVLPWRGCCLKTITHPHFGPEPVEVFAIAVQA